MYAVSTESGPGRLVVITGLPGSGKTTLATELARSMPAVRLCPDDWMMSSGIDLWNDGVRCRIEQFQLDVALNLLCAGGNVVIEWGVWSREERDALRDAARAIGAAVELR
jgi:predicted kinase